MQHYQVFLFDFDGLLVDTEPVHFLSYIEMCRRNGWDLDWSFERFCKEAHEKAGGIWEGLSKLFPTFPVGDRERIEALYREKKEIYVALLEQGGLRLMPGVEELILALQSWGGKCAVVTNSPKDHIEKIKEVFPILREIPLWITREDYSEPKPSPEGYLKAVSLLSVPGDRIVGFEDTLKGAQALFAAGVDTVLVCPEQAPHVKQIVALGGSHVSSLANLLARDT